MKRDNHPALLPLLLLALFVLVAQGCDTMKSPADKLYDAKKVLTESEKLVLFLDQSKMLSDRERVEIAKVASAADAALREAEKQLPKGDAGFDSYLSIVLAAAERFAQIQAEAKTRIKAGVPPLNKPPVVVTPAPPPAQPVPPASPEPIPPNPQ